MKQPHWRRFAKRVPGLRGAARWLRAHILPHGRTVRAVEQARPGQLLQPEPTTRPDRYPRIFGFLATELAGVPAPRVLSWGCSTGHELVSLACAIPGAQITGVDINPRSLARARARVAAIPGVTLRLAGDPAELAGEQFDAVVCMAVLRHARLQDESPPSCAAIFPFARAEAFMAALAALVRPGGLLAAWNVHFRFADMAPARDFTPALDLPRARRRNQPLYGPDDRRMDGATCTVAVFRRRT